MPRLNTDPRQPAHFRTMRETLGISRQDLARILDVAVTSARDWDLRSTAPDAAWDILDRQAARVDQVLDDVLDSLDDGSTGPVSLTVYRSDEAAVRAGVRMPASWHRACIGHVALELMAQGHEVEVSYAPEDA